MKMTYSRLSKKSLSCRITAALTVVLCLGCVDQDSAITTEMHEDFDHDHKHLHTGDDDHEHEHKDGFKGSHAHGHSHSHRHGEPLYGGRIVSIGHTHHKDGATHFHAEVMPLTDNTVRFHLLTTSHDGNSKDYPVDDAEIPALISIKSRDSRGMACSFVAIGDGNTSAEFALELPELMDEGEAFSVVVPKLKLNGNRQNFSFSISRKKAENDGVAAGSALESSDE